MMMMMTTTAAASLLPCKAIGCVKPRRPGAEPPSPLPVNAFNGFPGNAKFNAQHNSQSQGTPGDSEFCSSRLSAPVNAFNGFPGNAKFNAQDNFQSRTPPAMVNSSAQD